MTFILTAVPLCAPPVLQFPTGEVLVRRVEEDELSWARAGYLPGLTRYLGARPDGGGYYLLVDEGGGYETSNPFFRYADEDDEPARFVVPDEYRGQFEGILDCLLAASSVGQVVLVLEDNGHVTSTTLTQDEADTIDVIGPITAREFRFRMDLGEIVEDSVVVIQAGA